MPIRWSADSHAKLAISIACGGLAGLYVWYYASHVCRRPELYYKDGKLSQHVLKYCSLLVKPYKPTCWAFNAHAQTTLSVLRALSCRAAYKRQLLSTEDGGTVALDWYTGGRTAKLPTHAPVVLVLHGLTGGSSEGYCKWMCSSVSTKGYRAVVLNYRGCGGVELTSPTLYCASFTDDVHLAIEEIQQQYPRARLFAAGYSLGSMILSKYLAEAALGLWRSAGSGVSAAVLVSNPFCMHTSKVRTGRPWTLHWLYNVGLAHRIKQYIVVHNLALSKHAGMDLAHIARSTTIEHLDERVVCKLFGYATVEDYYTAGSSMQYIPDIKTPSLFLISQDDPFLGKLPTQECNSNQNTVLAVTARGGHVAFLEGWWPFRASWMDKVAVQFFDTCDKMPQTDLNPSPITSVAHSR